MKSLFFRNVLIAGFMLVLGARAYGVTSAEYANAGLQLYTAKNYSQAIQYYSAAISLDPNNAAALQGRANCYYSLGQLQQALSDYEKVQAISPSDQLSQFIQALRAKVGTVAPATGAAPAANAPMAGSSFDQGVALYQQKQFAAAIPYFQRATQENPSDSKAYYYLGAAYLGLGDMKNAAVNLAISNQKQPNPSVEAYVNQLKVRLSPEDQQWVDGQVAASATAGSGHVAGHTASKAMGIRLEPGVNLLNMTDFLNSAQANQSAAATLRNSDSTYNFIAHVPTLCANVGIEPVLRLSPSFELGLPIGLIPAGTADDNTNNSNSVTVTDSFQISAFEVGLNARYLLGTGSFQPFIAAGVLVVPININYAAAYSSSSLTPTGTATALGNFTGMGFGGQAQLGLDWHLGDSFAVSPFVAYQLASANSLTSTITSSGNNSGQAVQLSVVPTADGKVITPIANGKLVMPVVTSAGVLWPNTPAPAGTAPLTVDLSGIDAGIQISIFF